MTRRGTRRAGFTLPELVIATMLLTVGMLSVASLMAASHRQHRLAVSRGGLTTLAEAKLDSLRSFSYASTANGVVATEATASALRSRLDVGGSLTSNVSGYFDVVTAPNGKSYDRRWEITNDFSTLNRALNVRRVTVRLVAQDPGTYEVSSVDFSTLVWFQ